MRQTATAAQGVGGSQPTLATQFVDGDEILVTLTAEKPGGERIALSYAFNTEGAQINNKGDTIEGRSLDLGGTPEGEEPQFPSEEYRAALKAGRESGENDGEADRIIANYKDEMSRYQASGGAPLTQRIASGVFGFIKAEHGVQENDHNGLVLKQDEVVVRAPVRREATEAGLWVVQLAPTWG